MTTNEREPSFYFERLFYGRAGAQESFEHAKFVHDEYLKKLINKLMG